MPFTAEKNTISYCYKHCTYCLYVCVYKCACVYWYICKPGRRHTSCADLAHKHTHSESAECNYKLQLLLREYVCVYVCSANISNQIHRAEVRLSTHRQRTAEPTTGYKVHCLYLYPRWESSPERRISNRDRHILNIINIIVNIVIIKYARILYKNIF